VGLSAAENGIATRPIDLDILWEPHDRLGSAREARRFLLRATLIYVAEELNEYAKHVLKYRALGNSAASIPGHRADRILALARPDDVNPGYLTVAPLIVSHWRNRIVHPHSAARLTAAERQRLLAESVPAREHYKGIDVARLLKDFDEDRPTLKDVTVLLAMSITFVRQVDSTLPEPASREDVRRWLEAEDLLDDVLKLEKEATNGGHPCPRGRGKQFLITKAPGLAEAYYAHGAGIT
jgi:hypothetical protein